MLYATNFSTLKTRHLCRCLYHRLRPSHNFPCSSATKLAACGHFRDKSPFFPFLPAPETKQCSRKSVADVIYPKSGFGRASASGPSTQEVGRGVWLAASSTRTSTDSDSTLLSSHIRNSSDQNRLGLDSFGLINPQQSV